MRRAFGIATALGAALATGSCSPPAPDIIAAMEDGDLVFHLRERGIFIGKPFGYDDEAVDILGLWVLDDDGGIMWEVATIPSDEVAQYVEGKPHPVGYDGEMFFPVTYGKTHARFSVSVEPKKLTKDRAWRVLSTTSEFQDQFDPAVDPSSFYGPEGRFVIDEGGVTNLRQ